MHCSPCRQHHRRAFRCLPAARPDGGSGCAGAAALLSESSARGAAVAARQHGRIGATRRALGGHAAPRAGHRRPMPTIAPMHAWLDGRMYVCGHIAMPTTATAQVRCRACAAGASGGRRSPGPTHRGCVQRKRASCAGSAMRGRAPCSSPARGGARARARACAGRSPWRHGGTPWRAPRGTVLPTRFGSTAPCRSIDGGGWAQVPPGRTAPEHGRRTAGRHRSAAACVARVTAAAPSRIPSLLGEHHGARRRRRTGTPTSDRRGRWPGGSGSVGESTVRAPPAHPTCASPPRCAASRRPPGRGRATHRIPAHPTPSIALGRPPAPSGPLLGNTAGPIEPAAAVEAAPWKPPHTGRVERRRSRRKAVASPPPGPSGAAACAHVHAAAAAPSQRVRVRLAGVPVTRADQYWCGQPGRSAMGGRG